MQPMQATDNNSNPYAAIRRLIDATDTSPGQNATRTKCQWTKCHRTKCHHNGRRTANFHFQPLKVFFSEMKVVTWVLDVIVC